MLPDRFFKLTSFHRTLTTDFSVTPKRADYLPSRRVLHRPDLDQHPRMPRMLVQLDLNQNDRDALLRHCQSFRASSGDPREDARLADALEALQLALEQCQANE